ncbi:hypothetical protein WP12_12160 [Sphingomonas sp. SRS2]|nr:hypothetical protein WP12_12160 [Sphingomonas sp. SRS2]
MDITTYRTGHAKLTLEDFAAAIGLKSKGQMSEIERSNKCSVAVALAIEAHSKGLVDAAGLNSDVAAVRQSVAA